MKKIAILVMASFMVMISFACAHTKTKYPLSWAPQSEKDWDIIPIVKELQVNLPADIKDEISATEVDDLYAGISFTYEQNVLEYPEVRKDMSIQISQMLINVSFTNFSKMLPAASWGDNLKGLIGNDIKIYKKDILGRVTRQLERMVLSPILSLRLSTPFNMDMTKVEVIEYEKEKTTVYWRVMYSDNNSTESDIGSVEFKRYEDNSTLVTFHSAHRLNYPLGISMHHWVVRMVLKKYFLGHISNYKKIVLE